MGKERGAVCRMPDSFPLFPLFDRVGYTASRQTDKVAQGQMVAYWEKVLCVGWAAVGLMEGLREKGLSIVEVSADRSRIGRLIWLQILARSGSNLDWAAGTSGACLV